MKQFKLAKIGNRYVGSLFNGRRALAFDVSEGELEKRLGLDLDLLDLIFDDFDTRFVLTPLDDEGISFLLSDHLRKVCVQGNDYWVSRYLKEIGMPATEIAAMFADTLKRFAPKEKVLKTA